MIDEQNIDDFEQFLKTQADKHRMYPSDQIWRNINQQLHGNSRWPALTFAAILTGALLTAGLIFLRPDKDLFKLPVLAATENNITPKNKIVYKVTEQKPGSMSVATIKPMDKSKLIYSFNTPDDGIDVNNNDANNNTANEQTIAAAQAEPLAEVVNGTTGVGSNKLYSSANVTDEKFFAQATELPQTFLQIPSNQHVETVSALEDNDVIENGATGEAHTNNTAIETNISASGDAATIDDAPVITADISKAKKKPTHILSVQVYGGPSISYRRLVEPEAYDYHFPYNVALTADPRKNVNKLVTQRPAIGFEFGAAAGYTLTENLKVKAGLQFNFRQYTIDAYNAPAATPAVLLISNNNAPDSMIVYSALRNGDGYRPVTIQNRYYQIAVPVGLEWTFTDNRKVNISLGATIQPTYQLNTNIYMLTSDYKSYIQQPDLIRRWNINAGVEAMANFDAGGLKWQVGPQLRYQMQPSQSKSYTFRENLVDYGIKIGVIKQLR